MQQAIWEHSFAPQSQDDEEELSGTSHPDHEDHHHDHVYKDKQSGMYQGKCKKKRIFLGLCPKLWVGGGQKS